MKPVTTALRQALARIRCVTLDVDGVLTDGRIVYGSDGTEYKAFNVQDGLGIKKLHALGLHVVIISGRDSNVVAQRAHELGIRHVYQGIDDKPAAIKTVLAEIGCDLVEVAHMGDDEPDRELFELVGVGVAVANAVAGVKRAADVVTQRSGGDGAVREFCDLLQDVQSDIES